MSPDLLDGSVWIEWETVADGGVGMWINRLAGRLTDGIYRRPRRTRELISLGEHASARFIRLGRKFGSFPRSGGSINRTDPAVWGGNSFVEKYTTFMHQTLVLMITDFGNTKWERVWGMARLEKGSAGAYCGTTRQRDKEMVHRTLRKL